MATHFQLVVVHDSGAVAATTFPEAEARQHFDFACTQPSVVYAHYSEWCGDRWIRVNSYHREAL